MEMFISELPKSCSECPCCNNDIDYGACCNLDAFEYREYHQTIYKHPKCPLKPLSDRLAEERKKIVQEIRDLAGDYFEMPYCDACGNTDFNDVVLTGKDLTEILDDVERGE